MKKTHLCMYPDCATELTGNRKLCEPHKLAYGRKSPLDRKCETCGEPVPSRFKFCERHGKERIARRTFDKYTNKNRCKCRKCGEWIEGTKTRRVCDACKGAPAPDAAPRLCRWELCPNPDVPVEYGQSKYHIVCSYSVRKLQNAEGNRRKAGARPPKPPIVVVSSVAAKLPPPPEPVEPVVEIITDPVQTKRKYTQPVVDPKFNLTEYKIDAMLHVRELYAQGRVYDAYMAAAYYRINLDAIIRNDNRGGTVDIFRQPRHAKTW